MAVGQACLFKCDMRKSFPLLPGLRAILPGSPRAPAAAEAERRLVGRIDQGAP